MGKWKDCPKSLAMARGKSRGAEISSVPLITRTALATPKDR